MSKYILFLLLCFSVALGAQTQIQSAPETQSIDNSEALLAIDLHIQKYVDEGKIPGGVFMVAKDGQIIYNKSFGENAPGDPYQSDDIFRIASMTKAITCTGIMQLQEQGKLNLDDPVSKYIPSFANIKVLDQFNPADSSYTTVDVKEPITIRHLMSHTSGIYYGQFMGGKYAAISHNAGTLQMGLSGMESTKEMVAMIANQPLAHQPGEKWTYGLNMEVLGLIIQNVTGECLQCFFKENILNPIGMEDTWFYLPEELQSRLVRVHSPIAPGKIAINPDPLLDYPNVPDHDHYAGGGGLSGTARDYMLFTQALLGGGSLNGQRILKPESVELMISDQLGLLGTKDYSWLAADKNTFGLGFSITTEESPTVFSPGTYAWGGYFNTKFWIDPVEHMTFVGMTQILPFQHNEFWNELYALIYQAVEQ